MCVGAYGGVGAGRGEGRKVEGLSDGWGYGEEGL